MTRPSLLIYLVILGAWGLVCVWQVGEHERVKGDAREYLTSRARDITSTLGIVLRSQRRFITLSETAPAPSPDTRGPRHLVSSIQRDRFESAMKDLIKPGEVNSIVVLNAEDEEVAAAGQEVDPHRLGTIPLGAYFEGSQMFFGTNVDMGTNFVSTLSPPSTVEAGPPLVSPRRDSTAPGDTNRPPGAPTSIEGSTNRTESFIANVISNRVQSMATTNVEASTTTTTTAGRGRSRGGRMSEGEYRIRSKKEGAQKFVIVMSTQPILATIEKDLLLRYVIGLLATVAAIGLALARQNLLKNADLQIRLVRASEQNAHLKELNLAAAGLAHETRNPLNIIRGLAQINFKQDGLPPEIRQRSRDIVEEADRVTAQLSEFINYSRPREVRRATVSLGAVVADVARTLAHDLEEKKVHLQFFEEPVAITADEQLLRQAVFNLLLNASQAVPVGGEIRVVAPRNNGDVSLEVRDNGPGVPSDQRKEIFKPYFTTHQKGSGLGLAVVQQIVTAHDWTIECLANEPQGAVFRISGMKSASKTG